MRKLHRVLGGVVNVERLVVRNALKEERVANPPGQRRPYEVKAPLILWHNSTGARPPRRLATAREHRHGCQVHVAGAQTLDRLPFKASAAHEGLNGCKG